MGVRRVFPLCGRLQTVRDNIATASPQKRGGNNTLMTYGRCIMKSCYQAIPVGIQKSVAAANSAGPRYGFALSGYSWGLHVCPG